MSTPCFRHMVTESLALACAHSRFLSRCASSTHALVSSSVKKHSCAERTSQISSPDMLSLMLSAPMSSLWWLTTRRISEQHQLPVFALGGRLNSPSGPSANAVIPATRSPPGLAISLAFARYRGPGISPALMASRTTTSRRSLAEAAPKHLRGVSLISPQDIAAAYIVYPESKKH